MKLLTPLATLAFVACASDPEDPASSRERRCAQLGERIVEMRLGNVDPKDREHHREVLRRSLGGTFVASCTTTMSDEDITCALAATDVTAAAACTRHVATN